MIEAAALSVLQKHADFGSSNSSRGDYRQIGHGRARVAVLVYGGAAKRQLTFTREMITWVTFIDLLVPWPGQMTTFEVNLDTERQKVIDTFLQWPKLDAAAGVTSAQVDVMDAIEPLLARKGAYRGQRLVLTTNEVVDPNRQE